MTGQVMTPKAPPSGGTPPALSRRERRRLARLAEREREIPAELYGLPRGTITLLTLLAFLFAIFTLIPIAWLHQIAAEIIVESGKPTGVGMTPRIALSGSEALGRQLSRDRVHTDFRIYQHVRSGTDDRASPCIDGQGALNESVAKGRR